MSAQGQYWQIGPATQERIAARKGLLFESSGSFGYDRGLKSDEWEIPDDGYGGGLHGDEGAYPTLVREALLWTASAGEVKSKTTK